MNENLRFERGAKMLSAFKEKLKDLAYDSGDSFKTAVKRRVGKRATALLEKRLKRVILLMPELVSRAYRHWNSDAASSQIKRLGGFLLTYLYHPKDFLPEEEYGFFGYLDDAYLVLIVYESVLLDLQKNRVVISAWDEDFLSQCALWKKSVRAVIRDEAKRIDSMLEEILMGREGALDAVFS